MKKIILTSVIGLVLGVVSLSAAQVVATSGGSSSSNGVPNAGQQSIFKQDTIKTYTQAEKYTTAEIESDIKDASNNSLNLLNNINALLVKKRNPVDGKVEAALNGADGSNGGNDAIVSAMTQIRANVAEAARLLEMDYNAFSEKDKKALKALKESNAKLEKQIASIEKTIPVADSNIKLGSVKVPVIGTSRTQVFPILEGDKTVGSLRVVCGAYLVEDQLINNHSVNYCIGTTWINASTRTSDVHKYATTDTYFVGISEPYIPGRVSEVTLHWDTQAKTSVKGLLKFYNIKDPKVLKTMNFENTVITSDGTKFPGKDALVQ